ncbi:hypothetical protein [Caballeronia telluris]|uniref:Uncharacterized protein n=1 Tax=Caballeronia telluris TaxID=326475 RepID=A0A158JT51_9BURK|nr:hypothetical protein [Caballeronia telluris]SAL72124.1 hypothetical protein AWB66_04633 [Caballeronia telluris]
MKPTLPSIITAACLASASVASVAAPGAATLDGVASMQVAGNVKAVNLATRVVTVVDAQGNASALQVGPGVQNLDALKAGTPVTGTTPRRIVLTALASGEQAPRMAQVVSADSHSGVVVLKDAQGAQLAVQAREPARAASFAAGSHVAVDVQGAAPVN